MSVLLTRRAISLTTATPRLQSARVAIGALTSEVSIRLRRPTTAAPLAWDSNAILGVELVLVLDGVEQRCRGRVSGGVRVDSLGREVDSYRLVWSPTIFVGDRARTYLATATRGAGGVYSDVPLTRITEASTIAEAYVVLEALQGTVETELLTGATSEAPAPVLARYKNSVAFNAATGTFEENGDGIVSVSHTASGSDAGVFAANAWFGAAPTSTSIVYGGTTMTELWDISNGNYSNAGHHWPGGSTVPTGAQTVTSTLSSSVTDHIIVVLSMTGVHQTTPVGTPNTATGSSATPSVTVASVGVDDLVMDNVVVHVSGGTPAPGADQTGPANASQFSDWTGLRARSSYQSGIAGGIMSYTITSNSWAIGAVAFKPAGAAGRTSKNTAAMPLGVGIGMAPGMMR